MEPEPECVHRYDIGDGRRVYSLCQKCGTPDPAYDLELRARFTAMIARWSDDEREAVRQLLEDWVRGHGA